MKLTSIFGAMLIPACLLWLPLRAQTWTLTGATAFEQRTDVSVSKTTPFFDRRGSGVHFVPGTTGDAFLYLPVNLQDKSVLRSMTIRVDGVANGFVKVALYQQLFKENMPILLGSVAVGNKASNGVLNISTDIKDHVVNNSRGAYFVRAELCKDPTFGSIALTDPRNDTRLYDLNFSGERCQCPPPPPPSPLACRAK